MSNRFGMGILASLEDEEEAIVVEEETPEEVADDAIAIAEEAPAEAELGLQEADQELEDTADKVEEIDEAIDELEEVKETLESFVEEGGMNRQTALLFQQRITRLNTKLMGKGKGVATPSVESFGTAGSAYAATTDSLEAVKDLLAKAKAGILKAIEYVRQQAQTFYRWVMDFAGRQGKALAALKEAAGKVTGTAEGEIEGTSGIAKALHVGGKMDAASIASGFTAFNGAYQEMMKKRAEVINKLADILGKEADAETIKKEIDEIARDTYFDSIGKGATEFSGGVITQVTQASEESASTPAGYIGRILGKTGITTKSKDADAAAAKMDKLPVLKAGEMSQVLDAAIITCKAISDVGRQVEGAKDPLGGALAKFSDAAAKLKEADKESDNAKFLEKVAAALPRASKGAPEALSSHELKAAKALGVYVAKSIKKYGKAAPEAA